MTKRKPSAADRYLQHANLHTPAVRLFRHVFKKSKLIPLKLRRSGTDKWIKAIRKQWQTRVREFFDSDLVQANDVPAEIFHRMTRCRLPAIWMPSNWWVCHYQAVCPFCYFRRVQKIYEQLQEWVDKQPADQPVVIVATRHRQRHPLLDASVRLCTQITSWKKQARRFEGSLFVSMLEPTESPDYVDFCAVRYGLNPKNSITANSRAAAMKIVTNPTRDELLRLVGRMQTYPTGLLTKPSANWFDIIRLAGVKRQQATYGTLRKSKVPKPHGS